MKVIVREKVNHIATPVVKKFSIIIDALNSANKIPASIGLVKGDLIVFRGDGDPVRFPSGSAYGKYLMTDPTSETGWALGEGGSGSSSLVTLHNSTGEIILAGTVVKIDSGTNFVKATASDNDALFVVSDECGVNEDAECYSIRNTICMVLCTSSAVSVSDSLTISSTSGVCESTTDTTKREVAVALTAKESGSAGTVKALLVGVNDYAILEVKDGGTGANTASGARTNLGALAKSGDTITGNLLAIAPTEYVHKSPNYSADEEPSESVFDTAYVLKDADNNVTGYLQHYVASWLNGAVGVGVSASRQVNGSSVYNGISFLIGPDGTKYIVLDQSDWRSVLGKSPWISRNTTLSIGTTGVSSSASAYLRREGNVVSFMFYGNLTVTAANTYYAVANIPSGYKPAHQLAFYAGSYSSATLKGTGRFAFVNDTTTLYFSSNVSGGPYTYACCATWITTDS